MTNQISPALKEQVVAAYKTAIDELGQRHPVTVALRSMLVNQLRVPAHEIQAVNREAGVSSTRQSTGADRPRYDPEYAKKKAAQATTAQGSDSRPRVKPTPAPEQQAETPKADKPVPESADAAADSGALSGDERAAFAGMSNTEAGQAYGRARLAATLKELGTEPTGKSPAAVAGELRKALDEKPGK